MITCRRLSVRTKRPRQYYDPDEYHKPVKPRQSKKAPATEDKLPVRSSIERQIMDNFNQSCKKIVKKRGPVTRNQLICCLGCGNKVHKMYLPVPMVDFSVARMHYRCKSCNHCEMCEGAFDDTNEEILYCEKCARAFHRTCTKNTQSSKSWLCKNCKKSPTTVADGDRSVTDMGNMPLEKKRKYIKRTATTTVTSASVGTEEDKDKIRKVKKVTAKKPSVATADVPSTSNNLPGVATVKAWSVKKVTEYFAKYFPQEAHVFKIKKIDGKALLRMTREQVVRKLPIKLGPSLRIYELILKIQTQLDDPTLPWN